VTSTELDPKQRLMASAAAAFLRDGYGAANLGEIARSAGISKKTIYKYTESKAKLFSAVVEDSIRRAGALQWLDHDDGSGSAKDALIEFMVTHARLVFSEKGIATYRLVMAEARQFPELARAYETVVAATAIQSLTNWFERRRPVQRFRIASSERIATMLISLVLSEPLRRAVIGVGSPPDEDQVRSSVEEAVDVLLRGIEGEQAAFGAE